MKIGLIIAIIFLVLFFISSVVLVILFFVQRKRESKILLQVSNKALLEAEEQKLKYKVIDAIQNFSYKHLDFQTYSSVTCPNPELRTKLVGKEARNKRCIENLTGVNLEFTEDSSLIKICSNNNIEREIARLLLLSLINSGSTYIDELKIKKYYDLVLDEFNKDLVDIGRKICIEVLHAPELDENIYPYIGKLNYRLSYGQNNLEHSIECAQFAYQLAPSFNLDPKLASLCAFFHDIGKSIDYDTCMHHSDAGLLIAKKCHFEETVAYCIKFHHSSPHNPSPYLLLTKLCDRLSASKDGLRTKFNEDVSVKTNILASICKSMNKIEKYKVTDSAHCLIIELKNNCFENPKQYDDFVKKIKSYIKVNELFSNYYLEIKIKYNNSIIITKL